MRGNTGYSRSGTWTGGSWFPLLVLLLLPVIVVILTAAFLGYALWRLVFLSWQFLRLAWHVMRDRVPGASSRAMTLFLSRI
jgi:hypothetical protein